MLAPRLKTSGSHSVLHVFRMGACIQMIWSHARFIITTMADLLTIGNRTISQLIRIDVCPNYLFSDPKKAVLRVFRSGPFPTGCSLIDLGPKPLFCRLVDRSTTKRATVFSPSRVVHVAPSTFSLWPDAIGDSTSASIFSKRNTGSFAVALAAAIELAETLVGALVVFCLSLCESRSAHGTPKMNDCDCHA